MSSSDNHGPFSPISSFGRSMSRLRKEKVHSLESNHKSTTRDLELESFQKQVTVRFEDLSRVSDDELLSVDWMRKLLDAFICCHEEFRAILLNNKEQVSNSPLDRSISEFFERLVKALDICNASSDGIEKIRVWLKHLDIVLCALSSNQRALSEGQVLRARKALMDLALTMLDEKDCKSVFPQRNRSFGRHNTSKDHRRHFAKHSRSHSWSVSRPWSAAKQLHSIANNLAPPRESEIVATSGLAIPIYTMNSVLLFVLWTLVAAIPCQDRGLNIQLSVPKQFSWSTPVTLLHERIKKRERRSSNGLLKEINEVESCVRHVTDLVDTVQFPLTDEQKVEVEQKVKELSLVFGALRDGLNPLERQVREVFHKIMSCRAEGL
ncbi:UPF0496 protein 4 isoform X1 [Cajanus cajan]|uniref:Uncharacterized protein n=2 Tax=Cajanus cajan TaxID=3821 RepID=A0A151T7Z4_CAJCA|nr:UPF0496 protein 4 isoform X1 [Cajanus cajan]KYP63131.1 hypothetical protein KK1_017697 [Cajanus cajan]